MKSTKSPQKTALTDRSTYAYASLVLGLLSLLAAYMLLATLGGILGLSGLVYAFVARDSRRRMVGRVGAAISGLGLLASLLAAGVF
jgi:uncharacterized membrane protein YozB (DUF420 family)